MSYLDIENRCRGRRADSDTVLAGKVGQKKEFRSRSLAGAVRPIGWKCWLVQRDDGFSVISVTSVYLSMPQLLIISLCRRIERFDTLYDRSR